jgi:predicted site-specific integrase-resolvase
MKPWLSVKEAALVACRNQSNIYEWIQSGKLPHTINANGRMVVSSDDVLRVEASMKRGRRVGTVDKVKRGS